MDPELAKLASQLIQMALKRNTRKSTHVEYDFPADEAFVIAAGALQNAQNIDPDGLKFSLQVAIRALAGTPLGAPEKTLMNAITTTTQLAVEAAKKPGSN